MSAIIATIVFLGYMVYLTSAYARKSKGWWVAAYFFLMFVMSPIYIAIILPYVGPWFLAGS